MYISSHITNVRMHVLGCPTGHIFQMFVALYNIFAIFVLVLLYYIMSKNLLAQFNQWAASWRPRCFFKDQDQISLMSIDSYIITDMR